MHLFSAFLIGFATYQLLWEVNCKKKKSGSRFSFDSLLSGMDLEEKKMFKEELEKEVKKFHIPSRHKPQRQNVASKRSRSHPKHQIRAISRAPITPGICDPICEHQCVHGCDFRCCIPHYQVTHRVPRPLPHVSLPGSCSTSCSPTCYPECTPSCCAGGPNGMFQSTKDLQMMYPPTCPPPCPGHCFPHCERGCCDGRSAFLQQQQQSFFAPRMPYPPRPPQTFYQPNGMMAGPSTMPMQQPISQGGFNHCGGQCPQICAPNCLTSCCMQLRPPPPPPPMMIPPQMVPQPPPLIPAVPSLACSETCPSTCAPACLPTCCNPIPQIPQQPIMLSMPQLRSFPPSNPASQISVQSAPIVARNEVPKSSCQSSCPSSCLPNCTDSCCNASSPHSDIEKKSKISKIAAQLAMLRKKHK